jgi:hypothetical protein
MTNFTVRNLHQVAIYWGNPVKDGYGGNSYDDPVEIPCRWEDSNITENDPTSILSGLRSEVQVDQDLDEEGMLKLGYLIDLDSDEYNDPIKAKASMIVRFSKIPNIKGTYFYRKAFLGRSGVVS